MTTYKPTPSFDFDTSPLPEAQRRLADLELLLQRARIAVAKRLVRGPKQWKCWSQAHRHDGLVPKSVLTQCHGNIPDGRWVFKDDGHLDADGLISSIVCCSPLCFTVYQQQSQRMRAQAKGVVTMPEPIGLLSSAGDK